MSTPDQVLDRAEAALERARQRTRRRSVNRAGSRAKRVLKYSAVGSIALLLAAFLWGLVSPIGTTGVMIVFLAVLGVVALSVVFSREAPVVDTALAQTPIRALPAQTARWLDQQRPLLPAPAQRLADGIGLKLEALVPQVHTLDDREPAVAEIRRLIADELPELVRGYGRVPAPLRRDGVDGLAPDKQLIDGLAVVDSELTRMSEQLARGDVKALATQGKYLELKYQGDPLA